MEPSGENAHIISKVAALDSKICEVTQERATLLQNLNYIRSPMISRIPPELLSRIFWFATRPQSSDGGSRPPHPSDTKALFDLRSVCSHWRRVTQSSPQLWTALAIVGCSQTRAKDYTGLVRHYYQCLGATSISFYMANLTPITSITIDEIMRVILKDYPGQLKSLHLRHNRGWPALVEYAKGNTAFPHLEELELGWARWSKTELRENSLFRNSPRLRTLSLIEYGNPQISPEFPWRQITTLKLTYVSPKHSFQLLGLCPYLVNYEFSNHNTDGEIDEPWVSPQQQTISMQFIRNFSWLILERTHLSWEDGPREEIRPIDPHFFAHFRFPAVRKFHWYAPLPSDTPSVRDFCIDMQELEELEICLSGYEYQIDWQYLNVFGNLTTLKVEIIAEMEEYLASEWLWHLTIRQGKDNLFPYLQRLHLRLDGVEGWLIAVLCSRRNGPVNWSSAVQRPSQVILPSYDPTSTHWQHHARLLEFSGQLAFGHKYDWRRSPHYYAMETMMSEAREVEGFGAHKPDYDGPSRILF